MAEKTYKLTAPNGTKVEVTSEARRDTLLARGYSEGTTSKTTEKKTG